MLDKLISNYWLRVDVRGDDECWPWKGARSWGGYGRVPNGLPTSAKRSSSATATHVALAIDRRPRPSADHVAMHLCDKPWCVNPRHLRWGTLAENTADMIAKGRAAWQGGPLATRAAQYDAAAEMDRLAGELEMRKRNAKLTPEQVRHIRASSMTPLALAEEFGVTAQCILDVITGRTWSHLK